MTTIELSCHLTDLHSLRSAFAVKHKIFCDERMLLAASFCAAGRDTATDAIDQVNKEITERKKHENAQGNFYET